MDCPRINDLAQIIVENKLLFR